MKGGDAVRKKLIVIGGQLTADAIRIAKIEENAKKGQQNSANFNKKNRYLREQVAAHAKG